MYFYTAIEPFNLYLKYEYLKAADIVKILELLESLHRKILIAIDKYQIKDAKTGEILNFALTISEVNTGNSIDFKFSGIWEKTTVWRRIFRSVKLTDKSARRIEFDISIELKDVIAFLLFLGIINTPNQNINRLSNLSKDEVQKIEKRLSNNNIWQSLQDSSPETFIAIEDKSRELTNYLIQNNTFIIVKIENIEIKNESKDDKSNK